MARLFLLTLLGVVLLSASQAYLLSPSSLSPDLSPNSVSDAKDQYRWEPLTAEDEDEVDDIVDDVLDETVEELADDDEVEQELTEEEKAVGEPIGFPVDQMTDEELSIYLTLEEQIFLGQADEHIGFQLLKEKRSLYTKGGDRLRRKRIAPLIARAAFGVARHLARRFARTGVTRSGSRITRHYNGRGNYGDAMRDFNRMRPTNVRDFNGRISGRTGTMGNHRVTVRDGSSGNSRPTLEIRSHRGDLVRKFRYNP